MGWDMLRADAQGKSDTRGTGQMRHRPERFVVPTRKSNHLQFMTFAGARGVRTDSMTKMWWRFKLYHTYLYYRFRYNTTCFYPDRMLGTHMSLDKGGQTEDPLLLKPLEARGQ
jgi:hypothetical protein